MRFSLASKTALLVGGLALAAAGTPASASEPHRLSPAELDSVTAGQITLFADAFGFAQAVGDVDSRSNVIVNTRARTNTRSASASASSFASGFGIGNADAATVTATDVGPEADPTVQVFRLNFAPIRVGNSGDDFVGEVSGSFAVGFQFVPPVF